MSLERVFGNWVWDIDEIEEFEDTGNCVCGCSEIYDDLGLQTAFKIDITFDCCARCERRYIRDEVDSVCSAINFLAVAKEDHENDVDIDVIKLDNGWKRMYERREAMALFIETSLAGNNCPDLHYEVYDDYDEFLIAHDGLYIGFVAGYFREDEGQKEYYINTMYIMEYFRKQNIGTEALQQIADEHDIDLISLHSIDESRPAWKAIGDKLDTPLVIKNTSGAIKHKSD